MSATFSNDNIENKTKLVDVIQSTVSLIHEPLRKFIQETIANKDTMNLISKTKSKSIKKIDLSKCLQFIINQWSELFSKTHLTDKFPILSKRCINILSKAPQSNKSIEEYQRELEPFRRLALLICAEVEESVVKNLPKEIYDENSSNKWESLKDVGNKYQNEGNLNEAIKVYTQAIQLDLNQPVLYSNRAIVELKLKKYTEAREDAEDAIALSQASTNSVKYHRLLSEALIGLDLLEEASGVCQQGLELATDDEVLKTRLKEISLSRKQSTIDFQKKMMTKLRNDPDSVDNTLEWTAKLNPAPSDILKISNQNDMIFHYKLAKQVEEGNEWQYGFNGKKANPRKAKQLYEDAANKGSANGLFFLG